jgi:hypothetical protein
MRTITQYFDLIASVAERSGSASVEIEFDQIDQVSGIIDGVLYFYDGSRLEFTERVVSKNAIRLRASTVISISVPIKRCFVTITPLITLTCLLFRIINTSGMRGYLLLNRP